MLNESRDACFQNTHTTMAKEKKDIASIFRYMGPALDALRALGGSGTPDEVVERITQYLNISDEAQNEILSFSVQRTN